MCPGDYSPEAHYLFLSLYGASHLSSHGRNQPDYEKTADILSDSRKYFIPLLPQTENKSITTIRGK